MIVYEAQSQTREAIVAKLQKAASAAAQMDLRAIVEQKATEIANAMALLHGQEWRVQIDHDAGFVMIVHPTHSRNLLSD